MRVFRLAIGCLALVSASIAARADTFTIDHACPAYASIRNGTNPGAVTVEPNMSYEVLAKNKPDPTHYRIRVEGAEPALRWVSVECGTVAEGPVGAGSGGGGGVRATHVLALSWQPYFCSTKPEKLECQSLTQTSPASKQLSLHGLWPQGRQFCNVAQAHKQLDEQRKWDQLPEPAMTEPTRERIKAVMPGLQSHLHRHEWIKHGTCHGGPAEGYFARSSDFIEAVNASRVSKLFADNVGRSLTLEAIRAAFNEKFGEGAGARVMVSCKGHGANRMIEEVRINLAGDVKGSAPLGDLMRAARSQTKSCPGGLVKRVGS